MSSDTSDLSRMTSVLEELRHEIARLTSRVAALESATGSAAPAAASKPAVSPSKAAASVELGEELLLVLSAAIAAFLGKKAHIRQVRLIGSAAWGQQGRVTIQASHTLSVPHP
jgi:methylmalonyl-CoA carboxyltransferase large subunit